MKPKRPEINDSKRDHMKVEKWIYSVDRQFHLIYLGSEVAIADSEKIKFSASLFSGYAADLWFILVQINQMPVGWHGFFMKLREDFVLFDA